MKKTCKANLPAMIFLFALLILWQAGAMGLDAAYILPSPHPDPGEAVGAAGCPLHRSSARHHAGDGHRPGDLSGAGPGPGRW